MKLASMTIAAALTSLICVVGQQAEAAGKTVPKAKTGTEGQLYALALICGVSGKGHCERAFFKMPTGLTKDGCKGMGMLYRGKLLGADETGNPGRVDTWECFTSQLPVKDAVSLGE
jgi:hypothetical protein